MTLWLYIILICQIVAAVVLLKRLSRGKHRMPPLQPCDSSETSTEPDAVTIVVPARNEAHRITDCLNTLIRQGPEVAEILVIDDESTDDTVAVAESIPDARIRVVRGKPLPPGWVGKAWALEQGLMAAKATWVLCVDADTRCAPGAACAILRAAKAARCDLLFVGPRFLVDSPGEKFLHPALMTTLIYRLGPGDASPDAKPGGLMKGPQMMSGPCFLFSAAVVRRCGGFTPAKAAFAEDAVMASHLSGSGFRVCFRDGAGVVDVAMYSSFKETWLGWGVSLGLTEVLSPPRQFGELLLLTLTQAAPLPLLILFLISLGRVGDTSWSLLGLNVALLCVRLGLLKILASSYKPATGVYWLSPLADLLAVLRILLSTCAKSRTWRGRNYENQPSRFR